MITSLPAMARLRNWPKAWQRHASRFGFGPAKPGMKDSRIYEPTHHLPAIGSAPPRRRPPRSSARKPDAPAGGPCWADPRVRLAAGNGGGAGHGGGGAAQPRQPVRGHGVPGSQRPARLAVTRPPGSSCSLAPSVPPRRRLVQRGWPENRELAGRLLAGGAAHVGALENWSSGLVRRPRPAILLPGNPPPAAPMRPAWGTRPGMPASPSLWALAALPRPRPSPPASSPWTAVPAVGLTRGLRRRPSPARHRGRRGAGTGH